VFEAGFFLEATFLLVKYSTVPDKLPFAGSGSERPVQVPSAKWKKKKHKYSLLCR
jgi:hypothetical protein